MVEHDTIAALSTPPGEGGIAIIRVSGPDSFDYVDHVFNRSRRGPRKVENRKMVHGYIVNPHLDKTLDEVLCVKMKGPYTYTGEDVAEIQCHGGMIPVREILELLFSEGVRPAEPGEFSKRAFLNGRLDLSQAESVIDIITSKTSVSKDMALKQLRGKLGQAISDLRDEFLDVLAQLEARIDFPDEELDFDDIDTLQGKVKDIHDAIEDLLSSYHKGKIMKEGVKTVIIGRPNVGKSSLLNLLLGEDRAIVTEIPGTTRDTLEEGINLRGIPLNIIDTAGIRESEDKVERIGVERTKASLNQADLVLVVLDASESLTEEDLVILEEAKQKPSIVVLNKTDLTGQIDKEALLSFLGGELALVEISALTQTGLDKLEDQIYDLVFGGTVSPTEDLLITNARHFSLLKKARAALEEAHRGLGDYLSEDLISVDVKEAYDALGDITGQTTTEDMIDQIFSNFCIGK